MKTLMDNFASDQSKMNLLESASWKGLAVWKLQNSKIAERHRAS